MTVTVLVADDEELTRTGLRALLGTEPDIDVIGEAGDGETAVALAGELRPDVVLMDVRMPGVDGIEATRRLGGGPKVLVVTTFENDDYVYDALRAGAAGFLLKRAPVGQIAHAVRLVAAGDVLLFPDKVRGLVGAHDHRVRADRPYRDMTGGVRRKGRGAAPLTAREVEVLRLMAAGLSNREIAGRLYVSLETVKTHVGNIFGKLGAVNRTQAVIFAYESGVVRAGEG